MARPCAECDDLRPSENTLADQARELHRALHELGRILWDAIPPGLRTVGR